MIDVSDLGFKRDDKRHTSPSSTHQEGQQTTWQILPSRGERFVDEKKEHKATALALPETVVYLDTYKPPPPPFFFP